MDSQEIKILRRYIIRIDANKHTQRHIIDKLIDKLCEIADDIGINMNYQIQDMRDIE